MHVSVSRQVTEQTGKESADVDSVKSKRSCKDTDCGAGWYRTCTEALQRY